ncbi:MAG: hypothetical protein ACOVOA_12345, partial [Allorhizobium sp.]
SIRMWPRMTRDQLARVFPDGKTVHIPADGKKMPGYAVAFAQLQQSGAIVKGQHVMLADSDEETVPAEATIAAASSRPIPSETTVVAAAEQADAADIPMPAAKPEELVMAAADEPTLVWQAGAQPADGDVPMPVARPGDDEPEDLPDDGSIVVAAADPAAAAAEATATDEAPPSARA